MKKADRIADAELFLANLPDDELMGADVWYTAWWCGIDRWTADRLLNAEQLKRGLIKLSNLTPEQRRALVDKDNLDLHAIASGPIMDPGEIYLPAGKLSMAETRQRELACILPDSVPEERAA
jgi:hypothetical protein